MSEDKPKVEYIGNVRTPGMGSMPVRGIKRAKSGKHKSQQGKQAGERDTERQGEYIKVGALGWSRDFKNRISDYNDVCKELYKIFGDQGKTVEIAQNLRKFQKQEEITPKHKTYTSLEGIFWAYAIMKTVPPAFVLSNYGFSEQYFKDWVVVNFVHKMEQERKPDDDSYGVEFKPDLL